jgi:hypothetical protein
MNNFRHYFDTAELFISISLLKWWPRPGLRYMTHSSIHRLLWPILSIRRISRISISQLLIIHLKRIRHFLLLLFIEIMILLHSHSTHWPIHITTILPPHSCIMTLPRITWSLIWIVGIPFLWLRVVYFHLALSVCWRLISTISIVLSTQSMMVRLIWWLVLSVDIMVGLAIEGVLAAEGSLVEKEQIWIVHVFSFEK